nr:hypothetical protein [Tanacetum cinerariifolium]
MSMESSAVVEPVVQTGVPKPRETKIDNAILTAFELLMWWSTLLSPLLTKRYGIRINFSVSEFSKLKNPHAWYKLDKARVDYMWMDQKANKLYFMFHDKHGVKMAVEVPQALVNDYKNMHLVETYVSIEHFQISYVDPTMYPRFQNYSFVLNDWVITFNPETVVAELLFAEEAGFRAKAWMVSIRAHDDDRSQQKMLIVNILVDTELSRVEFNPVMREADLLKKMWIS